QEHERERHPVRRQRRAELTRRRTDAPAATALVAESTEVATAEAAAKPAEASERTKPCAAGAGLQVGKPLTEYVLGALAGHARSWRRLRHLDVETGCPDRDVAPVNGPGGRDREDRDVGHVDYRHASRRAGRPRASPTAGAATRPGPSTHRQGPQRSRRRGVHRRGV